MTEYNWLENSNGKLVHGEWLEICGEMWFIEDEEPEQYFDTDALYYDHYED